MVINNRMTYSKLTIGLGVTAAAGIGAFVWEYIARRTNSDVKPSVGISYASNKCGQFFNYLGSIAARISSFYTYIEFEELVKTFQELFVPMWNLVTSPFYMLKGYVHTMKSYKYPFLVIVGSLTLFVATRFLYTKYVKNMNISPISYFSSYSNTTIN